ncbi:MAG: transposase, partial [Deltaproteobacteria bacterium]|nr:transposase [Deltaproteobacteria bacterium]
MNLIDTISGNTGARSVAELSLNPLFRREYSSLYDAVQNFFVPSDPDHSKMERDHHQKEIMRLVGSLCPPPTNRSFWLLGLDVTPAPRAFSPTLEDRSIIHYPNPAPGNNPIAVGHQYSTLASLPEKQGVSTPPWVIPLSVRRVPTQQKGTETGADQLAALLDDNQLPFGNGLSVTACDSAYSA